MLVDESFTDALPFLLAADQLIIVVDNIRFLSQTKVSKLVQSFSQHPNIQILINRVTSNSFTSVQDDKRVLSAQLAEVLSQRSPDASPLSDIPIHHVSSPEALDALDVFRNAHLSDGGTFAVETYQAKFQASNISNLSSRILHILRTDATEFKSQARTGAFLASYVLQACRDNADQSSADLVVLEDNIRVLMSYAASQTDEEARMLYEAGPSRLDSKTDNLGHVTLPVVRRSLVRSQLDTEETLEQYPWWSLPWRVDTIGDNIRDVVLDRYAKDIIEEVRWPSFIPKFTLI